MNRVETREVHYGRQVDGHPWFLRFVEVTGSRPGPTVAVVAGIWGDKPMGCLAVHELIERVAADDELAGTVIFAPAVNLPALSVGRRDSPDGLSLNRRFPGSVRGALTDQVAHHLVTELVGRADLVIDLHSGTPVMALHYTYDFGHLPLSAAFGRLPIVVEHTYPGQLCSVLSGKGIPASLPEFGGGPLTSLADGVTGVLNVLRWTGQISGDLEGPAVLPVIRDLDLMLVSVNGVLQSSMSAAQVGSEVVPGVIGTVTSVVDGSVMEEFVIDRAGGQLLMSSTAPIMVSPGQYAFMVGYPFDEIVLPRRATCEL